MEEMSKNVHSTDITSACNHNMAVTLCTLWWGASDGGHVCDNYKSCSPFSDRQEEVNQMTYMFFFFVLKISNICCWTQLPKYWINVSDTDVRMMILLSKVL